MLSESIVSASEMFMAGNYTASAELYEEAIAEEPDVWSHYWYLGLCLLLQGHEFEAQAIWYGMGAEQDDTEAWSEGLVDMLCHAASQQETNGHLANAWLIRRYIHEFCPENINNALQLILLASNPDADKNIITELGDIELTQKLADIKRISAKSASGNCSDYWNTGKLAINSDLLITILSTVLDRFPLEPITYELANVSVALLQPTTALAQLLLGTAIQVAYDMKRPDLGISFAELCLRLNIDNLEALRHLAAFYQNNQQYDQGIEVAKAYFNQSPTLADKIFANHILLRGLTTAGGFWEEAQRVSDRHHHLVHALMEDYSSYRESPRKLRLFSSLYEMPYLNDNPEQFRSLQNQIAQLCQDNIRHINSIPKVLDFHCLSEPERNLDENKRLTIGYLTHCFKRHSVGWLARWLIQHHDRGRFQLNGYFQGSRQGTDGLREWYLEQFSEARIVGTDSVEVAQQIQADGVDILVDLDSITLDITCEIMALKPAPIQATWLGWDASGIPAIDYFIADPYVLPDNAQQYYNEKIWRLPQTYLAVDGFEVAVPTLRRDQLGIPSDAVIYFSSQRGFKRHPDTVKLQLQILKEVPNSYFLVKGKADEKAVFRFFSKIAEEVGVSCDRLKFLPFAATESEHRANMAIADVVLDTYPYNGATTTMETLWMGLPLVTLVGEQFAARNSYTMLMNAGVTEGIAWTEEEYVSWGVRLGKDENLRKTVHHKLIRSRQSSPLWNGKAFAQDMENAYRQMWQRYIEQS